MLALPQSQQSPRAYRADTVESPSISLSQCLTVITVSCVGRAGKTCISQLSLHHGGQLGVRRVSVAGENLPAESFKFGDLLVFVIPFLRSLVQLVLLRHLLVANLGLLHVKFL